MFCQHKSHKKNKEMFNISTFDACKNIKDAAEARGDVDMIARIGDADLIAMGARYHNASQNQVYKQGKHQLHIIQGSLKRRHIF